MLEQSKRILMVALAIALAAPLYAAEPVDSGEIRVNVDTTAYQRPALAVFADGSFVVVWTRTSGQVGDQVRARFFDHRGEPRGGEISLAVGDTNVWWVDQAVADHLGGFLLAWTGVKEGGRTIGIFVRRFRSDGTPRGKLIRASAPNKFERHHASIAASRTGNFAVVWRAEERFGGSGAGYSNAVGRIFAASGRPLTPNILLFPGYASEVGDDSEDAIPAALALAHDGTLIALVHSDDGRVSTYLVRLGPGEATRSVLGLGHNSIDPSLRASLALEPDGSALATWEDDLSIWGLRVAPDGAPRGEQIQLSAADTEIVADPIAALQADGTFVVTWTKRAGFEGDRAGIFARAFDAEGNPRGGDFQVTAVGGAPVIGSAGRGPVVMVWIQRQPSGFDYDVFARVLRISAIR